MRRIILAAAVLILITGTACGGSEVGRSFRTVVPAGGVEHVDVDIAVGEVQIRSGSSQEIKLEGTIRREYSGGSRSRERARAIIEDTRIAVEIRGDRAYIREERGPAARSRSRWVKSKLDLHITLPAGVNLDVEFKVGEMDIRGDFHDVDVDMKVGELTLKLPKQNVKRLTAGTTIGEVHADLGEQIMEREGLFAGRTHYVNETGLGVVDLTLKIGEIDVSLQ